MFDVVRDGLLRSEFADAETEFLQSRPHSFFIRGSTALAGAPSIYSLNTSQDDSTAEELLAFTELDNSANLVKIGVRYSERPCKDEYELMQMDLPLAGGCGTLSP